MFICWDLGKNYILYSAKCRISLNPNRDINPLYGSPAMAASFAGDSPSNWGVKRAETQPRGPIILSFFWKPVLASDLRFAWDSETLNGTYFKLHSCELCSNGRMFDIKANIPRLTTLILSKYIHYDHFPY